jgi:hypothetical protein
VEITHLRERIERVLTDLAGHSSQEPRKDTQLVFDRENDHYLYLRLDWDDMKRLYDVYVHIDIIDGLIWVQRDRTDYDVAGELVNLGVPKDQIVLAFHAPYKRKYTGFATGESA